MTTIERPPQLGTGLGLWPISQCVEWPNTAFIGLDVVPCQTDLSILAEAERSARSTSQGLAPGRGVWGADSREGDVGNGRFASFNALLTTDSSLSLPFDSGVFDMVHLRFVGLGVPEVKWGDLLEEAARVLRKGGILEIVEMAYVLPSSTPPPSQNSFASLLLADMIQPDPSLPIRFCLPWTPGLIPSTAPMFERTWTGHAPGALADAVPTWVKSALNYKGTGLAKLKGSKDPLEELCTANPQMWRSLEGLGEIAVGATVWAWSVTKS